MARVATMYSSVFGNDAYEELLTFMRAEKNDVLDEVREDFVDFCNKLDPPAEIYCLWEQVGMDVAYSPEIQKGGMVSKIFNTGARAITGAALRGLGADTVSRSKLF